MPAGDFFSVPPPHRGNSKPADVRVAQQESEKECQLVPGSVAVVPSADQNMRSSAAIVSPNGGHRTEERSAAAQGVVERAPRPDDDKGLLLMGSSYDGKQGKEEVALMIVEDPVVWAPVVQMKLVGRSTENHAVNEDRYPFPRSDRPNDNDVPPVVSAVSGKPEEEEVHHNVAAGASGAVGPVGDGGERMATSLNSMGINSSEVQCSGAVSPIRDRDSIMRNSLRMDGTTTGPFHAGGRSGSFGGPFLEAASGSKRGEREADLEIVLGTQFPPQEKGPIRNKLLVS
jgi:hypothetical protein